MDSQEVASFPLWGTLRQSSATSSRILPDTVYLFIYFSAFFFHLFLLVGG